MTPFVGQFDTPHGPLHVGGRALIMGVLNVTPDSFSDGGRFFDADSAVRHARRMLADGADLLDIGGESTRPGSEPVEPEEQIRRVLPVIERLRREEPFIRDPKGSAQPLILSVDTRSATVAEAALDAGADLINDVSALRNDPRMAEVAARHGAPVVLMHMLGTPRTMQKDPRYDDVVREIILFFEERIAAATAAGISTERIILDPGLGFGKRAAHNWEILRRMREFHALGRPLLVGPSRKRFLGELLSIDDPGGRRMGTAAVVAACCLAGVQMVRVHDVAEAAQVARVCAAVRGTAGPTD
jgi:dihydropteroate synthase